MATSNFLRVSTSSLTNAWATIEPTTLSNPEEITEKRNCIPEIHNFGPVLIAKTNFPSSRWTNLNCTFICIAWKLKWQTNLHSIFHFKIVYSLHKSPIAVRIRHEFVVIYLSSPQFHHQNKARWRRGEDERKISIDLANRRHFHAHLFHVIHSDAPLSSASFAIAKVKFRASQSCSRFSIDNSRRKHK